MLAVQDDKDGFEFEGTDWRDREWWEGDVQVVTVWVGAQGGVSWCRPMLDTVDEKQRRARDVARVLG